MSWATCSTQTVNQTTNVQGCRHKNIRFDCNYIPYIPIDQFRYNKIQPETTDLKTKIREITAEFVGFIPRNLALRSIVLSRTSIAVSKGLFTWKWGTSARWGPPPWWGNQCIHTISLFSWSRSNVKWGTPLRRVTRSACPDNPLRWGEFPPCESCRVM